MQQIYYDLHIHTALSPCADKSMLPCDIVGMAILNELDMIAITDHNSLSNVKAVCEAAKAASAAYNLTSELIVLPGIEVTTSEEVHVLTLFDTYDIARAFETELSAHYSQMPNREDIFGEQLICGSDDTVIGTLDRMLIAPTTITFDRLFALTQKYGGAFVPAHVDRGSFSVTSNLGFLPPNLAIGTVEFTSGQIFGEENKHDYSKYPHQKYVLSSDAHQLHAISERHNAMTLPERSAKAAIEYLRFVLH